MKRILIAECKQEVSSFNPVRSTYDDFTVNRGEGLLDAHRGVGSEIAGAVGVFEAAGDVQIVPAFSARSRTSAGTLTAEGWARILSEFDAALRRTLPVDAGYFSLHGAMSAVNEDDPEGALLQRAREILGAELPIVISLDLHGILTDRMLRLADAVVVYHTYPHVDFCRTGERAARLLLRIAAGDVHPVTAVVRVPALVRGDELITETGSIRQVIQAAQRLESNPPGLSAGMFWGNPFTDVPDLRSNSLVVTDGDEGAAAAGARELADLFWQHHEKMQVPLVSVQDAVRLALAATGTVGLVDAADAPSSGASGDGNSILRELVRVGSSRTALIPIVDAPAVGAAVAAGVGEDVSVVIGGALDPGRFEPQPLTARVRMLSDGLHRGESFGDLRRAGPTAVLESGTLTILATSQSVSLHDRALFLAHGLDPRRFDMVVIKSPHCERWMYRDWCAQMIDVDAPGSTSANLRTLGHTRCPRPIFPLDDDVNFRPETRIYRRSR